MRTSEALQDRPAVVHLPARRQDPRKLYAAHVDGRPAPSYDKLAGAEQLRWLAVALAATGRDTTRMDPAFKSLADQLVMKGPGGSLTGQSDLFWQLRLWGMMSASDRGLQPETTTAALVAAFSHLAAAGVDTLLGALEQPGDRPVASALMHSIGAAAVVGNTAVRSGLLGRPYDIAAIHAVERTLTRIAACYDALEDGDEPRREGKMLRSAAWNVGAIP